MSSETDDTAAEKHVLALAQQYRVSYQYPGLFIAGPARVQIAQERLGDFLAQLATAMGADHAGAGSRSYSRFGEYDQLARAVYVGSVREASAARLFEVFCFRAVNAGDPQQQARYTYPASTSKCVTAAEQSFGMASTAAMDRPFDHVADPGIEPQ